MESLVELSTKQILADPPRSLRSLPRDLRAGINLERFNQIEFPEPPRDIIFNGPSKKKITDGEIWFQDEHIGESIPPYRIIGKRYCTYHRGIYYHALDKYSMTLYHGAGVQMRVLMIPDPKIIRGIQALLIPLVRHPLRITGENGQSYAQIEPLGQRIKTVYWRWFNTRRWCGDTPY